MSFFWGKEITMLPMTPVIKHTPFLFCSSRTSLRFVLDFCSNPMIDHTHLQPKRDTDIGRNAKCFPGTWDSGWGQIEHCNQDSCVGARGHFRLPVHALIYLLSQKWETCKYMATVGGSASYSSPQWLDQSSIVLPRVSSSNWNENHHVILFFSFPSGVCSVYPAYLFF